MRFFFLFIFVWLNFTPFLLGQNFGQPSYTDSLFRASVETNNDTLKVITLNELSKAYWYISLQKSIMHSQNALFLAQKIGYETGIARSMNNMAVALNSQGNFSKALEYHLQALQIRKKMGDQVAVAQSMNNIGEVYKFSGKYNQALEYYFRASDIKNRMGDKVGVIISLNNIGDTYRRQKQYEQAENYFAKIIEIEKEIGAKDITKSITATNIGLLRLEQGNYSKAEEYLLQSLKIARGSGNLFSVGYCYNGLAKIYQKQGKLDLSTDYALKAISEADQVGIMMIFKDSYETLTENHRLKRDFVKAFEYQTLYLHYKDSLFGTQQAQQIQYLEVNKRFLEQEEENKELKAVQKEQDQKMREQVTLLISVSSILGIGSVLMLLLFRSRRNLSKKNKQIAKQKSQIEVQKAQIQRTLDDLQSTQTQLLQSEKMATLGQLTAGIAHEINNPINFVYAGVSTLESYLADFHHFSKMLRVVLKDERLKNDSEKIKAIEKLFKQMELDDLQEGIDELVSKIKIGAERTAEIVKGLRIFSRLDSNSMKRIDLHESLDATLLILNHLYKNRIKIIQEYDRQIPMLECFPAQINQVMMNLIANAVQAIENEGKILVRTEYLNKPHENKAGENQDWIKITIQDSGQGIENENLSRIFEPFFTTKALGQGTGLGLAISQSIIQKHKGRIEAHSEVGMGTAFVIWLPLNQAGE